MADLRELALAMPQATEDVSEDVFFTTPHFDGYPAVLIRIPDLGRIDREELADLVAEAWLTKAQKRVARAWLAENAVKGG
jgi:hypothetical protein